MSNSVCRDRDVMLRSRAVASTLPVGFALLSLLATGCLGPRAERTQVYDRAGIEVHLTAMHSSGTLVGRGFAHPAHFSVDELADLIAPIEIETRSKKTPKQRVRAIHPALLRDVADALATSFAQAGPDQTIAVQAVRKEQRFKVLNRKYLTSFIASYDGEALRLLFSRVEWPIPKAKEQDRLPTPVEGEKAADFRVLPSEGVQLAGAQGVAIPWRSAEAAKSTQPAAVASAADEATAADVEEAAAALGSLTPDTLHALADLEEARQAGDISESHYRAERDRLLGGG